jgi:hypothetical protein
MPLVEAILPLSVSRIWSSDGSTHRCPRSNSTFDTRVNPIS